MKIIRILNQRKMEFELSPDELFLAHQEYISRINRDYLVEWIDRHYQLTDKQREYLEQSGKLLAKLCEEKLIQEEKYGCSEEEAVRTACNKFSAEIQEVIHNPIPENRSIKEKLREYSLNFIFKKGNP